MIWEISDLFMVVFANVLSLNLMIVLLMASKPFLESRFSMKQLSKLLKFFILYLSGFMPAVTCWTFYRAVYRGSHMVESYDFSRIYILKMRTISTSTVWGNHGIWHLLLGIWIVGFAWKGMEDKLKLGTVLRKLDTYSKAWEDERLLAMLEEEIKLLGIRHSVRLFVHEMIPIPFMVGVLHTRIFLPAMKLSDSEVQLILKHELMHCKNMDYVYRRLVFLLCALYWFNPIVHRFADYFIEVNEMACDQMVLHHAGKKERSLYANLVLSMSEKNYLGNGVVGLADFNLNNLEKRIIHIMRKPVMSRKTALAFLSVGIAVLCPVSALAVTTGTAVLQDGIARRIEDANSTEEPLQEDTFVEYTSTLDEEMDVRVLDIEPRKATWIDDVICGKECVIMLPTCLPSSAEADIFIGGDDRGDEFRAGLIDSNKETRYVTSVDGEINHTFTIDSADDYRFFIEGMKTDNMHISGSITIFK